MIASGGNLREYANDEVMDLRGKIEKVWPPLSTMYMFGYEMAIRQSDCEWCSLARENVGLECEKNEE